jgi:HK97 family phage major capsid protein
MTIEELLARQSEIRARLQEIDTEHSGEELPEESRDEWNRLNEEFESNEPKIEELVARRDRVESLGEDPENREVPTGSLQVRGNGARGEDIFDLSTVRSSVSGPQEATREMRDRALRAIEGAHFPHEEADQDQVRGELERLIGKDADNGDVARHILQTGSPAYNRAFGKALAGAQLTAEEQRALSLSENGGGLAVPFTLDPTIIRTSNGAVNPLREISRVEQITTDTWKGVASAGVTASYDAESAEVSDDTPTLTQPEVSTEKAQAFVPFSIEIGQDWSSLQSELAGLIQDSKDELEASKMLSGAGSGSNEPFGVLTGATEVKETASSGVFAIADIYTLKGALPARFQPNASWVANDGTFDKVRQFDTAGGASLWARLAEGRPERLVNKPAYELSTMDTVAAKKLIAIYGDFRHFLIVDRIGMTVEVVQHLFGENGRPTGQRGLYAYWRNSSKVLTKAAFRVLKVKE